MMNVITLGLVLTSFATAGLFSYPPDPKSNQHQQQQQQQQQQQDVLVKEGHRLIMIEYEREVPRDPKQYSSQESSQEQDRLNQDTSYASGVLGGTNAKLKEAAAVMPNLGQGLSDSSQFTHPYSHDGVKYNSRDLICDAFGRCKHRIAEAFGKAKERVSETGEKIGEAVREAEEATMEKGYEIGEGVRGLGEKTKGVLGNVKERAKEAGEAPVEKTEEVLGSAKEGVKESGERTREVLGNMKDKVFQKTHEVEERVKEAGEGAKEKAEEVLSSAKEGVRGAGERAKGMVGNVKETVSGKAHEVEEGVRGAGEAVKDKTELVFGIAKEGLKGAGEETKEVFGNVKERLKEEAKEVGKIALERAEGVLGTGRHDVAETAHYIGEGVKEAWETKKEITEKLIKDVKKGHETVWDERTIGTKVTGFYIEIRRNFTSIFRKGKKGALDAMTYLTSDKVVKPLMGVMQMLGFAVAFGVSVWVTFVNSYVLARILPRGLFGVVQSKVYPVYFQVLAGSIGCTLLGHFVRCMKSSEGGCAGAKLQGWNLVLLLIAVLVNLLSLEPRASKVMFDRMKLEKEEGRERGSTQEEVVEPPVVTATTPATTVFTGTGATFDSVTATTPATTVFTATGATFDSGQERTRTTTTRTGTPGPAGGGEVREEDDARARLRVLGKRLEKLNTYSSYFNVATLMGLSWHLVYLGQRLQV